MDDNREAENRQKQIRKLALNPGIPHSYSNLFDIQVNGTETRIAFGRGQDLADAPAKFDNAIYMTYDMLLQLESVIGMIRQDLASRQGNLTAH